MRRVILGILSAVMLLVGGGLLFNYGPDDSEWSMTASILLRCGVLLGALCLALPEAIALARRWPPWLIFSTLASLLLIVVRPQLVFYLAPILGVLGLVHFVRWLFTPLPNSPEARRQKKGTGVV